MSCAETSASNCHRCMPSQGTRVPPARSGGSPSTGTRCAGLIVNPGTSGARHSARPKAQLWRISGEPHAQGCRDHCSANSESPVVPAESSEDRDHGFPLAGSPMVPENSHQIGSRRISSQHSTVSLACWEVGFEGGTFKTPPRTLVNSGVEAGWSVANPTPHAQPTSASHLASSSLAKIASNPWVGQTQFTRSLPSLGGTCHGKTITLHYRMATWRT